MACNTPAWTLFCTTTKTLPGGSLSKKENHFFLPRTLSGKQAYYVPAWKAAPLAPRGKGQMTFTPKSGQGSECYPVPWPLIIYSLNRLTSVWS